MGVSATEWRFSWKEVERSSCQWNTRVMRVIQPFGCNGSGGTKERGVYLNIGVSNRVAVCMIAGWKIIYHLHTRVNDLEAGWGSSSLFIFHRVLLHSYLSDILAFFFRILILKKKKSIRNIFIGFQFHTRIITFSFLLYFIFQILMNVLFHTCVH